MPLFRQRYDFETLTVESVDFKILEGETDLPPTYDEVRERVEESLPRTEDIVEWMIDATAANVLMDYYAFSVASGAKEVGIASENPSDEGNIVSNSGDSYVPGVTAGYLRTLFYRVQAANLNARRWVELPIRTDQVPVFKNFNLIDWGHLFQVLNLRKFYVQITTVAIDMLKIPRLIRGVFTGAWKIPGLISEITGSKIKISPSAAFRLNTVIPLPVNTINLVLDVYAPDTHTIYIRIRDLAGNVKAEIPVKVHGGTKYSVTAIVSGLLPRDAIIEVDTNGIHAATIRQVVVRGSIFG